MAKPEELKKGVEIWFKYSGSIRAEVVGQRPSDAELPLEKRTYKVRTLPEIQYLPPEELELAEPPKDPKARLRSMSPEWVEELARCHEMMTRGLANPADRGLATEIAESLSRLGFMIERP